jgi:hypothetical protein
MSTGRLVRTDDDRSGDQAWARVPGPPPPPPPPTPVYRPCALHAARRAATAARSTTRPFTRSAATTARAASAAIEAAFDSHADDHAQHEARTEVGRCKLKRVETSVENARFLRLKLKCDFQLNRLNFSHLVGRCRSAES